MESMRVLGFGVQTVAGSTCRASRCLQVKGLLYRIASFG